MAPIIYMIRHGEKPPKLPNGDDANGLSTQGVTRAQYLPSVFGASSNFEIGYILAEKPKKDGSRARPYDTVKPLADSIGLKIHTKDKDDAEGAAEAAKEFKGPGNVLICWEHGLLTNIAEALGVKGFAKESGQSGEAKYPGGRFDLIWVIPSPYREISQVLSEKVPGLDDGLVLGTKPVSS